MSENAPNDNHYGYYDTYEPAHQTAAEFLQESLAEMDIPTAQDIINQSYRELGLEDYQYPPQS